MGDNDTDDRSVLRRAADKIKDAVTDPDLERGLINQAAAMPAAGADINYAAGESPAFGTAGGFPAGTGAAAAGSLTDDEPVGEIDDPKDEPDL
ncbi:MAG TPA: hypothetical protein VF221_15470 [Chloroflexota bacterium]